MLVLEVDNHTTSIISGRLSSEMYRELKRVLGYKPEGILWIKKQMVESAPPYQRASMEKRMEDWDGYYSNICYSKGKCRCHVRKDYTHFSSGLLSKARSFFEKYEIPYELIDIRKHATKSKDFSMSPEFELRDYQMQVRDDACNRKRGIIKMATGGGKTAVAASIIAELGTVPFIFYVTSCELLHQARSELQKFIRYAGSSLEVGAVGAGMKEVRDVTVMTVQTAVRALGGVWVKFDEEDVSKDNTEIDEVKEEIKELIRSAKGIMCDEVQHWSSETCQIVSDSSPDAFYRYGLSATPWRDMGDDVLIDACFGNCIADISASFLIERGYLVRPEIFFIKCRTNSPYRSYPKIYKSAIKENTKRNDYISQIAIRMLEEGRLPLILIKQIEHGKILKDMIPDSIFLHGSISKKKRLAHLEAMRERKCGVTIATSIFDEGVDIRPLDALLLGGSGKSATRALQRIGRILRPYPSVENNIKKTPVAIDFDDTAKYLKEHSKSRRKIYETEPLFTIKDLEL